MKTSNIHPTSNTEAKAAEELTNAAAIGFAWQRNSALEAWFPNAAEELNRLRQENARLKAQVESFRNIQHPTSNTEGLTAEQLKELKESLIAMCEPQLTNHERGIAEERLADLLWAYGPELITTAEHRRPDLDAKAGE